VFESLNQRILGLAESLSGGEAVSEGAVQSLMVQIREGLPSMSVSEVQQLKCRVDEAIALMAEQKEQAAIELRRIRNGKNALNGYSHIRGYQTSQKLNRQA